MPSTNLPLSTSLKGTAGVKYFPEGSTSRPEAVHAFAWPPELVPQGGLRANRDKTRATVTSLDQKQTEHWSVGGSSGVETIQLRIRFDGWPDSLLNMLDDAADGAELRYYPRLESTNLKFPSKLTNADFSVNEDEDRFGHAEYQADLQLRDASTDFSGYSRLRGPNKLMNPRLARGTTNGVAEGWRVRNEEFTANRTIQERGQRQAVPGSGTTGGGDSWIRQDVDGVIPGDVLTLKVEVRGENPTDITRRAVIDWRSSGSTVVNRASLFNASPSTSWSSVSVTSTAAPSGAVTAQLHLGLSLSSTNASGAVLYRDASLTIS